MANPNEPGTERLKRLRVIVPQSKGDVVRQLGDPDLVSSRPTFRVSHQPNFLAYWKLLGQFKFAHECRTAVYGIAADVPPLLFVVNDYDTWRDEALRRAEFPALRGALSTRFYMNLVAEGHAPSSRVFSRLGQIPRDFPRHLSEQVGGFLADFRQLLPPTRRKSFSEITEYLLEEVRGLLRNSASWSDFSVEYMKWALTNIGISEVKIISGTTVMLKEQEKIWILAQAVAGALGVPESSLLWSFCQTCGCRGRIEGFARNGTPCRICETPWKYGDVVLPKILIDDLLDDLLYPDTIAFSHSGGLEHIIHSHATRAELGTSNSSAVEIVSDQGRRKDHNFKYIVRASIVRHQTHVESRAFREVYDRSRSGYYSSLYYFIGDAFNSRKFWN